MQTVLGANGQIGRELARHLRQEYTQDLRLVSRSPEQIHAADQTVAADLLDEEQTQGAIAGSDIVYFTAGLPMNTRLWQSHWPRMMRNVVEACAKQNCKLVYFDNTYMYPQTAQPQTEDTPFAPVGSKGQVRAQITQMLLDAMAAGRVQALICRAPEFYGPGRTQSITNATIIEPLKRGQGAKVFLRDDTLRSLIYTPDASRATALLGNSPDCYGQSWHLPCAQPRLSYRQFIDLAAAAFGVPARYKVLPRWQLKAAGMFNQTLRDAAELLPRYAVDNHFVSDKFNQRFPNFGVTSVGQGLAEIAAER